MAGAGSVVGTAPVLAREAALSLLEEGRGAVENKAGLSMLKVAGLGLAAAARGGGTTEA